LAISATARSGPRIAVRGPGVGVEASSASTDPDRGPWRSTASRPLPLLPPPEPPLLLLRRCCPGRRRPRACVTDA